MSYRCGWCQQNTSNHESHVNFMGHFTCQRQQKQVNLKILYHQTSPQNAQEIIRQGRMLPGSGGLVGAAVYFATNPSDTNHKAQNKGVILECEVDIGKVKKVPPMGDMTLNGKKVKDEGYDSVMIPRPGGTEFVVYKPDDIKRIKVHTDTGRGQHNYSAPK